jgi:cell division septation protein DedD
MAATVVAVVVFLCGVLVGRGVPLGGGLTVSGSAVESLGVDDLPPPTLSTPSDEPSAAAGESGDLTYFRRLSGDEPELETLGPEAEGTATALLPPPVDPPGEDGGGADPDRSPPPTGLDAPTVETTPSSPPVASTPTPSVGGFSVQVAALRSQESAQQIVNQLVAKGYPATVVLPETGNPVRLFRVQVGPYADRAEADRISGRLETEEQFAPFVTR